MREFKNVDVIVVGGGLAGLTAANYLAREGRSVLLTEKADRLGGRAQTTNKNGVLFNLGPHAFFTAGPAIQILSELGCKPSGGSPENKMLGVRKGQLITLPTDFSSILSSRAFTFGEKMEFIKLMSQLSKIEPDRFSGISVSEWVTSQLKLERVRQYFLALFRLWTYDTNSAEQSAGYAIKQGQLALQGVLYVNGGWQSIVERLREKALNAGVNIITDHKAELVIHHHGKIDSVQFSNGQLVEAPAVILTAGIDEACRLVNGFEQMSLSKWKADARPLYGACLDIALKQVPFPKRKFVIGVEVPLYYSDQSAVIPLSKHGETVIHVMKYNGNKQNTDARNDERQLTSMLDMIQPGWNKEVAATRYMPNMLIASDNRSFRTNGAGVAPGPEAPEIEGLYVAGDWVGGEGRLAEAAMASAKQAALQASQMLRHSSRRL